VTYRVWRIAPDTPDYVAEDLSGKGAETTGGRWNAKGLPLLYTSQTQSLACLETFVHLNAGGLPLNRFLIAVDIPDGVWTSAQRHVSSSLPVGWEAEPAGKVSIDLGSDWLRAKSSALLVVPSVIVPDEFNILINLTHRDSSAITAVKLRKWLYDPRMAKT
jgi:RES domain-containing protein